MIVFNSGARSRVVALLYSTCVLLSLAPSVVGPPERKFNQGQPELQQAMDNMVLRKEFMKKSFAYPSSDDTKTSSMYNSRAMFLLDEAENMLSLAKGIKEKAWLENFIHKLKTLASILEQNIANYSWENESYTFATIETAQTLKNLTAPDGHLSQHNSPDFKSEPVPENGPGQVKSNQMTSKLPLTLPEKNQVKSGAEYANVDQVTKPGLIPPLTEEVKDELVEELESLHKLSSFQPFDRSITAPETSSTTSEPFTLSPLSEENKMNVEQLKEKLKERIANEAAELKKLGETDENILSAMHIEGFKLVDSKIFRDEIRQKPSEHATVKRVLDENNSHYWNLPGNHISEPPKQIYMNNTFLGMHITLPPLNPRVLRRQFHYGYHRNSAMNNFPVYHGGLKGTIQKLQTQSNQNFLQRNHMYGAPNFLQQEAGGLNPYGASAQTQDKSMKLGNHALNPYVTLNSRALYMPYPLNENTEQKSNNNKTSTTYSKSNDSTEFTEEMKRQLRDGKVILISDSIVSSNYTSDKEKDEEHKANEPKKKK